MDINSVNIVGRSTKDVELRTTNNGTAVATISLAVNHGKDEEASFFDVVCFGKTAENVAKYVQRGRQVVVSGRLQRRKWQTKEGENRYSVEVIANQVQFVGVSEQSANNTPTDVVLEDIDESPLSLDELPF